MDSEKYWEQRKAREMYEYMEQAEQAAEEIATVYRKASIYIQQEAKKVFEKFQSKYSLSKQDAELLLKKLRSPDDIKHLKQLLKAEPDNESYKMLLESQAYKSRIDNMANLFGQLDSIVLPMVAAERRRSALLYEKLAEEAYYKTIFDIQQYAGYGFNFKALDRKNIEKVLSTRWSGKNFSQRIWENTGSLADAVKEEILINLLTGRPLKKAQDSIDSRFQAGASNARRLVRTESCYVCNQLHLQGYEACGVKKYIYLAILDLKTSQVCRSLDKKRFPVSEAQAGVNYPPMHPWCRSTTIADMPDELLKKLKQSAINPETGERILVPGDMNYKEWYEKYVEGKDGVLAKQKAMKNASLDKEQYERYRKVLRELCPETIEKFKEIKYNDTTKYQDLKQKYRTLNQYKIDNGNLTASEILKIDGDIIREKRNNFSSDFKKSGNIAGAKIDAGEHYYIAHSNISDSKANGYKGGNVLVGLKDERHYKYINVKKSDGTIRRDTFHDTEAKLFEYLADLYKEKPFSRIDMLSERGMCDSCLGVMDQFIKEHPDVTVNAVSNKKVEGNVWKHRLRNKKK